MSGSYIIEVIDRGEPAFLAEEGGELFLTRRREEATAYATELDARCAKVYVGDNYQPRIVPLESGNPQAERA
jgi:hypothetical protein